MIWTCHALLGGNNAAFPCYLGCGARAASHQSFSLLSRLPNPATTKHDHHLFLTTHFSFSGDLGFSAHLGSKRGVMTRLCWLFIVCFKSVSPVFGTVGHGIYHGSWQAKQAGNYYYLSLSCSEERKAKLHLAYLVWIDRTSTLGIIIMQAVFLLINSTLVSCCPTFGLAMDWINVPRSRWPSHGSSLGEAPRFLTHQLHRNGMPSHINR